RASLLTGTIPSCHGVHDWLRSGNLDARRFEQQGKENPYGGYASEDMPIQYLSGQTTYTDVLAQSGYTCALSGKWHLGDSLTPQHGFRHWYTLGKGGCFYYHPDVVEDGDITVRHGEYVTDLITDKAISMVDALAGEDNPFYLSVHYTAPHSPWGAEHHPPECIARYEDCAFESIPDVPDHPDMTTGPVYGTPKRKENLRGYFAAITAMDAGIGRILDCLEEKGLADNTIVIFTADNGMSMGHHGIWGKGNGTFPMNMYDTAVKVPFLIQWPGHIEKGTASQALVSAYDLFPTLIDVLELPSRAAARLPGKSFRPALAGEDAGEEADVVVFDEYGPVRMIRTREYKYIHRYPYGKNELYDLRSDPGEEQNRIDDAAYGDLVLEMRGRMERWFARYANPDIDGTREGVTGLGQLCSAGIYAEKLVKYAGEESM
ncbi:sulfatase-like hydrolase/transferase, partial [Ruminococcaceae bacterium OttesenSCG-928-L11]|nr:sulfatase-like hydrolase/transferase [Ruminococcaceae bacterium OttesenSCG-928-L11]